MPQYFPATVCRDLASTTVVSSQVRAFASRASADGNVGAVVVEHPDGAPGIFFGHADRAGASPRRSRCAIRTGMTDPPGRGTVEVLQEKPPRPRGYSPTPAAATTVCRHSQTAKGRHPINLPQQSGSGRADEAATVVPDLTRFGSAAAIRPQPQRDSRVDQTALIRDVWYVLARARTDDTPRTLAAAQDAVFQRYLPMARTLANNPGTGRSGELTDAEQAAEIGLAQAVLGWRRPDSDGFEVVARAAIASQLHRMPPVGSDDE